MSVAPPTHPILKLIAQGEHVHQDFKFAVTDSKKIARTLSAFANTTGGKLLIGVKDNGVVIGVKSDEEYHMIEAAATIHTKPEVMFRAKKHIVNGKVVLEIDVPESSQKPHLAPDEKNYDKAFIRINDQNRVAHPAHFKALTSIKTDKSNALAFTSAEKFILSYLSENKTITDRKFCKYAGISRAKSHHILAVLLNLNLIKINYLSTPPEFSLTT